MAIIVANNLNAGIDANKLNSGKLYTAISRRKHDRYIDNLLFKELNYEGNPIFSDYDNKNIENITFPMPVNIWMFYKKDDPYIPKVIQDKIKAEEMQMKAWAEKKARAEEAALSPASPPAVELGGGRRKTKRRKTKRRKSKARRKNL